MRLSVLVLITFCGPMVHGQNSARRVVAPPPPPSAKELNLIQWQKQQEERKKSQSPESVNQDNLKQSENSQPIISDPQSGDVSQQKSQAVNEQQNKIQQVSLPTSEDLVPTVESTAQQAAENATIQPQAATQEEQQSSGKVSEAKVSKREPTQVIANRFIGQMIKFVKTCSMYKSSDFQSSIVGEIKAGKKLWIDPHNSDWRKAYRKSGPAYVSKDCLGK